MSGKRNRKKLYEGKAKILYEGSTPDTLIQYFKDDATAFNKAKMAVIPGKGILNNRISERIMLCLHQAGIPTHFVKSLNMREQLVRKLEVIPLEVIVRNYAAGSFCKRLGVERGKKLSMPIVEFCFKNDELGDPLVTEDHIYALDIADNFEVELMRSMAMRINDVLTGLFSGLRITLVDFKIEFGRCDNEELPELILADEISPDSCRLWDMDAGGDSLDKDRFREEKGGLIEAYAKVAARLGIIVDERSLTAASSSGDDE
ncbi:MAG: phosphoribosylaminoimidazolesuccinocarboxamide synthase [Rickettsiales bacterium]